MIHLRLQWSKVQCALPAAQSAGKLLAESWADFSGAVDAEDNCSHGPVGRVRTSHSDVAKEKIAGCVLRTRRFDPFFVYGVGAPAGLVASFFFPLPAFTSTSVADIV